MSTCTASRAATPAASSLPKGSRVCDRHRRRLPDDQSVEQQHQGQARQAEAFAQHAEDEVGVVLRQVVRRPCPPSRGRGEETSPGSAQGHHLAALVQLVGVGRRFLARDGRIQEHLDPRLLIGTHLHPEQRQEHHARHQHAQQVAPPGAGHQQHDEQHRQEDRRRSQVGLFQHQQHGQRRQGQAEPTVRAAGGSSRDTSSSGPGPGRRPAWRTPTVANRHVPNAPSDVPR